MLLEWNLMTAKNHHKQCPLWVILLAIVAGFLGGCQRNAPELTATTPAPGGNTSATNVVLTLAAELTQVAAGIVPTQPGAAGVETALPGTTPQPTATGTPVPGAADGSCYLGGFVADVTVPDGQVFQPGENFTKIWRLKNLGTCPWTPAFDVVFQDGDAMSGPASFPVASGSVQPGEEIEIAVDLKAPVEPGDYRGNWKLRAPSGYVFGLGSSGAASFWIEITVAATP